MLGQIILGLLILMSFLFSAEFKKSYWENTTYDKWMEVPLNKNKISTYSKIDSVILSHYIKLYYDVDVVTLLSAKKYKKISCDTESHECGKYKAKVLISFKSDIKDEFIYFIDDLGNAPNVYREDAIYFLHKDKEGNIYYQDEFFQLDATEEWIEFFNKLVKNKVEINNPTYKSLYSFCKATGIKESEIRVLNPWINKKATNIPPNAEIIIPNRKAK